MPDGFTAELAGGESSVPVVPTTPTPSSDPIPATPTAAPAAAPASNDAPVVPTAPADGTQPTEETLYDLPDGRKVTAEVLAKEWKENFLPDYTRKSQALAARDPKGVTPPINNQPGQGTPTAPNADVPYWKREDWEPKSYAEIVEAGKQEALLEIARQDDEKAAHEREVATQVDTQMTEIKKIDPTVNEDLLFQHALKFKFTDLQAAHANMKAMHEVSKNTEARVIQNVTKRNSDPVSVAPGAQPTNDGSTAYQSNRSFGSALEYFQSVAKK